MRDGPLKAQKLKTPTSRVRPCFRFPLAQTRETGRCSGGLQCKDLAAGLLLLAMLSVAAPVHSQEPAGDRSQALLDSKEGAASLLRGSYEEAETRLSRALASGNLGYLEKSAALKNRGVARWRRGQLREAVEDFNAAVQVTPEDPTVYNNRGNVLVSLGMLEEAIKDFDAAIAIAPHYAAAFNNRGNAYALAGNHDAACRDFSKAIELAPENAVPFNGRGKTQLLLGRRFGALRDLKRATSLNGSYLLARRNLAKVLMALQRYDEAIEEYSVAAKFGPKAASLYVERGRALAMAGRMEGALEDFTTALNVDPSYATALAERSKVQAELGREDEAAADLKAALALDGRNVVALSYMARSLLEAKAPAAALRTVEIALHADAKNALALRIRGEIMEALKRPDLALADYRESLQREPFQTETLEALTRLAAAEGTPPSQTPAAAVEGWTVLHKPGNQYLAENRQFSVFRFPVEMYGPGEPKLIGWKWLKPPLRNFGMLSYDAGSAPDGTRLEYAALINTKTGKVHSIEPLRWGDRVAEWSWNDAAVVVKDPDGVPNTLQLAATPTLASAGAANRRATQAAPSYRGLFRWPFR